jgi:hypothetical protein
VVRGGGECKIAVLNEQLMFGETEFRGNAFPTDFGNEDLRNYF